MAWSVLRHRIWPIAREVGHRFAAAHSTILAGHFAYVAMLAFLPFLIFATALTGFVIGPEGSEAALATLLEPVPEHVAQTVGPVIGEVIGARRSGVLTLAGLGALWASGNGMEAVRIGFDVAYGADAKRHYALNRAYLLAAVVIGILSFMALAALIIVAPLAFRLVESMTGIDIPGLADLVRYALGLGILYGFLWSLHRLLPSVPMGGMILWPGILASAVLWVLAATGMSVYLAFAPSFSLTYGTLAGVILTLLFFYITGAVLLLGAHVNAVVNRHRGAAKGGAAKSERFSLF